MFDFLFVVAVGVSVGVLSQLVEWLFVLRTEDYKTKMAKLDSLQEKIRELQHKMLPQVGGDTAAEDAPSSKKAAVRMARMERQIGDLEAEAQSITQSIQAKKFVFGMINTALMIATFARMSTTFAGTVVAKLPFEPWGFIQNISHRGLDGDDATDCSYLLVYILVNMFFRPTLQKFMGIRQQAAQNPLANMFGMPQQ